MTFNSKVFRLQAQGQVAVAIAAAIFVTVACGSSSGSSAATVFQWRVQTAAIKTDTTAVALDFFAKELSDKSNGRIKLTVYYNDSLQLPEANQPQLVRDGVLQVGQDLGVNTEPSLPETNILSIPGLVPGDVATQKRAIAALAPFLSKIFNDTWNQMYIGSCIATSRNIILKQVPTGLASIKGLKIRAGGTPEQALTQALGAIPVAGIASAEIYTSLQTGVVSGAWGPNDFFAQNKMGEVAKGELVLASGGVPESFTISNAAFNKLPADLKAVVKSAAADFINDCFTVTTAAGTAASATLTSQGTTIVTLTSAEQAQVAAASAPLVKQWLTKYPQDKDLMAAIQAAIGS